MWFFLAGSWFPKEGKSLDGKLSGNYSINAEQTLTHLDIDLAGTQDLKIAIQSEDYVKYGFVIIKAEKE